MRTSETKSPARKLLADIAVNVSVVLGIASFSYGFWLAWRPLGFIIGGLVVFALAVVIGRSIDGMRRSS